MSDLKSRLLDRVVQYGGCTELTLGTEQVITLCDDLRASAVRIASLEENPSPSRGFSQVQDPNSEATVEGRYVLFKVGKRYDCRTLQMAIEKALKGGSLNGNERLALTKVRIQMEQATRPAGWDAPA